MKTLRLFLTSIFMLCCSVIYAYDFEVDGIYFSTSTENTVSVTFKDYFYNSYSGDIVIPKTVEYGNVTYSVTSIVDYAFLGCSDLTSLVIPEGATSIGQGAFSGCSSLTSLIIPEGVISIGGSAFSGCSSLTSLSTPSTVENIPSGLFSGLSGALYINCDIPDAENYSSNSCFYGSNFSEVTFGDSVTSIGDNAFEIKNNSGYSYEYHTQLKKITLGKNLKRIGKSAFPNCSGLTSLVIPEGVTSIGDYAFRGCSGLTSLVIPEGVTSIGGYAFQNCSGLTSLSIPSTVKKISRGVFHGVSGALYINCDIPDVEDYYNCGFFSGSNLSEVTFGDSVTSIGDYAFDIKRNVYPYEYHTQLKKITLGKNLKRIGKSAFYNCSGLTSLVIPESVTSISENAIVGIETIEVEGEIPADIMSNSFGDALVYVPIEAFATYAKADVWNGLNNLTCKQYDDVTITSTALSNGSGVLAKIGDTYMRAVVNLKVTGSINSYDVIIFRDKTPALRYLDLSEANVEASTKAFYNGYCTKTDTLGAYAFYNLGKLRSVKLPKNLLVISDYTFRGCNNLMNVEIPSTVKSVGSYAFYNCSKLTSVKLPNQMDCLGQYAFNGCALDSIVVPLGIKSIESSTFYNCSNLKSVALPRGLENIANSAFRYTAIEEISLPPTVKRINGYAFSDNSSLVEVRIPSSVLSISDNAFGSCSNLKKVYTNTVQPTQITENTFSTSCFENATLYVPSVSYYNYYWDDGWKRFLNFDFFDEPYEYFYLNNDIVFDDNTGYVEGEEGKNPDVDIYPGGGLVVEGNQTDGETPNQSLGNVNVENDGLGNSGSIIGDNNLSVDNLAIKINVTSGKWYFFAFPFDIMLEDITLSNGGSYVWRYYDGEERAKGNTGWKTVNGNKLNAAQGYIFQCSKSGVLTLNIENVRFKKEDKYLELMAHVSNNLKDASWNYVGNPYLSYYDMNDLEYTAPVTRWDGSKYVAMRPGDDEYHFTPFEAFFVQKSEGTESVGFDGDKQMTQNQSVNKKAKAAVPKMQAMNEDDEPVRQLINLVLAAGEETDGTRIVFNDAQSRAYESECDAAKFETQGVVQLFTIGDQKERYAINERPADNGIVSVGFTVPTAGDFTISATRMDTPVYLKDLETGALFDLSKGDYNFSAKAGSHVNRFEVLMEATVTGVQQVGSAIGEDVKVYDLSGRRAKENGKGVYIINGEKTLVK